VARTILVVEDEPTLRETLAEALESDGFRVTTAADGAAALALFRAEPPDLILLDLMLPELSGLEVTRVVRADSNVRIVVLTARGSEVDKVVGLELGADDYVTKPFSLRELSARIRGIFRRGESVVAGQLPPTVELGPVRVDVAGHRILRDGREVPVDYAGETRTVDVHVHWLRSAIESDPGAPSIVQTVRGVGYVLCRPGATAA
jgi:two-component system response regulator RegX3